MLHPQKVVIFDNDQDMLEMMSLVLEEEGFETFTMCSNDLSSRKIIYEQALKVNDPNVIIVDVSKKQDYEVYLSLKGCEAAKGKRFILTTTDESQLNEILEKTGMRETIVAKPFDVDIFLDAVRGQPKINKEREL